MSVEIADSGSWFFLAHSRAHLATETEEDVEVSVVISDSADNQIQPVTICGKSESTVSRICISS